MRALPYLVVEVPVEPQDVGVPQVRLDFYFTTELVLNIGLLKLRLEQHLQGASAERAGAAQAHRSMNLDWD